MLRSATVLLLALVPGVLAAQPIPEDLAPVGVPRSSTPLEIPRLASPITLDGRVDDRRESERLTEALSPTSGDGAVGKAPA